MFFYGYQLVLMYVTLPLSSPAYPGRQEYDTEMKERLGAASVTTIRVADGRTANPLTSADYQAETRSLSLLGSGL